jgi:hypothetical protein
MLSWKVRAGAPDSSTNVLLYKGFTNLTRGWRSFCSPP